MKRDMNLIRELMLKLEELPPGFKLINPWENSISDSHSAEEVFYHFSLMSEAGLIETEFVRPRVGIMFKKLTWEGHDFVDSVRDSKVWEYTQKGLLESGSASIDIVKELAKGYIKKFISEKTGIDL